MKIVVSIVVAMLFLALLVVVLVVANTSAGKPGAVGASTPPVEVAQAPDPVPAQPKPVQFDIQGMKLGDKLVPRWALDRMDSHEAFKPEARGLEEIEVDGKKIRIHYQFAESKLIEVSLTFGAESFNTVVKAYTSKFGVPPHSVKTEPLENRMGAKFTNIIATWQTTDGPFIVEKYGIDLNQGMASIQTPEAKAYWSRKVKEDEAQLRSKL